MATASNDESRPDGTDLPGTKARTTRRRTVGDRVRTRAASSAAARPQPSRSISAKARIEGLEPREKQFSFVAGALCLVMGLTIYLVETHEHHLRLSKGQLTPQTTLLLGILFGVLLLAATLIGRRALIGFVSLFAFLAFGTTSYVLGLPFLALAVWLLYRSYKFQKDAAATAKATQADRPSRRGSESTAGPTSASTSRSPRTARSKGPTTPEANKRYTPKRLPPPAPKPSRRARKASAAD